MADRWKWRKTNVSYSRVRALAPRSFFFSNAPSFEKLAGSFDTVQLNTPAFSIELDIGEGGIFSVAIGKPSFGASLVMLKTYTPYCLTGDYSLLPWRN